MTTTSHTAPGPFAGYLFQKDLGPLILFRLEDGQSLTLERQSDLAVLAVEGGVVAEIEAKHSIEKRSFLSSKSVSLWKTLALWLPRVNQPGLLPPRFRLVTSSFLKGRLKLLADPEDARKASQIEALCDELDEAAETSSNKKIAEQLQAWKETKREHRFALLQRTTALAGKLGLSSIQQQLRQKIIDPAIKYCNTGPGFPYEL
ncbi:MAG: hypothetical protein MPN21_27985, partial [Thermoanaerobaculia bacterium]|nr:hypothetical protein [Thermoanaerobaculia bacterium]